MKHLAANGEEELLDDLEQSVGFKYDPMGFMFDEVVSDMVDMTKAIYTDTAHCLLASGGIAQFHINQFVLRIVNSSKTTLADLDRFASRVNVPRQKLTKTFFQDRIVAGDGKHARCFASETWTVVVVLGMFADLVLVPDGRLVDEVKCLKHLEDLLFHIGAQTIEHAVPAQEAARQHHILFLQLYPECAKPKLHYLWHAILSWLFFGVQINCMGAEAEHKAPKRVMHFAYKNCYSTALAYYLRTFLAGLQNPETFEPTHLTGIVTVCNHKIGIHGHELMIKSYSKTIVTPRGHLAKGQLVRWGDCIGIVKFFLMVTLDTHVRFCAVVLQYVPVVGIAETWVAGSDVSVCTSAFSGAVSFVQEGQYLRPRSRDMCD